MLSPSIKRVHNNESKVLNEDDLAVKFYIKLLPQTTA